MKKMLYSLVFLLSSIVLTGQGGPNPVYDNPDAKGLIKGKIVDKSTNVPMEYTSIALYNLKDSSLVTGTVTNTSGEFVIEDLPFGQYFVEVHFVGYEKKIISPLQVNSKQRHADLGSVELKVNTKMLQEAEIVADQRRVEYKLDKKVVNVSEDLNAAGGTAVDVLENTPSVSVDIEGNVTLRGSSSFTVLINGKPTVLDAADALRQIPASNIQNIEIITNPSVKYDPDGNAGIVNVVLKKQIEKGTTGIVNASVGLNHKYRFDALLNKRVGKINYFIGGGYDDNIYEGTLTRERINYPGTLYENYLDADGNFDFNRGGGRLKAGLDYDFSPGRNLAIELSGGKYNFGIDRTNAAHEYDAESSYDLTYMNLNMMNRTGLYYSGNLSYSHEFDTSAHKLVILANFSRRNGDEIENQELLITDPDEDYQAINDIYDKKFRNLETGIGYEYRFQVDYTRPIGKDGKFEAGYQARIDDDVDDFKYQEYDPDTKEFIEIEDRSSDIYFYRNIQSAYAQYGGRIGNIQLQAGLRGEYTNRQIRYPEFNSSNTINRFDLYPTLHLARQFQDDNQLVLSYSKRVNRPRGHHLDSIPSYIDNYTIRIGNPALLPEYVHSYELGYQKGWGKNFLAIETYYRNTINTMSRYADFDSLSRITYMTEINLDEDHVIGGEVMANWQFAKWFKINASTNLYYYRLLAEIDGEEIDKEDFSWNANLNATFTITPLSRIQANLGYRGPTVTAQGSAASMYYLNLAVRQDLFKRKLSATLQMRNVLGSMKRDFTMIGDDFSQHVIMQREPRMLMLTLSYKINNYRIDPSERGEQEGGGMDMDAGF